MKDPGNPRTGVIPSDKQNVAFYLDECILTLLQADYKLPHKLTTIHPAEDGFVCGRTHSEHDIAIYVDNKSIHVIGSQTIDSVPYIISTSNFQEYNLDYFWGIEFVGGTLSTLTPNDLSVGGFTENGGYLVKPNKEIKKYTVHIDEEECSVMLGSYINVEKSFKGVNIHNNSVYLRLLFPSKKPRIKVFEYLEKILKLVSFMSFRENVGFKEIFLLGEPNEFGTYPHFAQLFFKNETKIIEKPWIHNILFDDLGEQLPALVELFTNTQDKKPAYMLGFIPENDKQHKLISGTTVREVASALECEMTYIENLCPAENDLKALVKEVKKFVKQYQKDLPEENKLPEKTYNLIHTDINHWSLTAAEKISALYHRYEEEMLVLNPSSIHISDEEINNFVKYRNDITHGYQRVMDKTIATTTYVLQGLVYCCLLTRIGMKREQILELCKNQQILK